MTQQIVLFFLSPLLKWVTLTYAIGAGCIALWLFMPTWLAAFIDKSKFLYLGIALLSGGTFYWYAFHAGERQMAQRIAAKDTAAIERVNVGRQEVEDCNGGIDWDVTTGTCRPGSGENP